ncbi:hypothetical protein F5887DRAFT_1170807 [Amanita rubescens]|nr:hypothetical protein F5887DRAFT_1170807 [Amanita rubescens]
MSEIFSIEINCADDGSFALKRALCMQKLIEVNIISDKKAPRDSLGNYVVSFWRENGNAHMWASLPSVVLVDVRPDVSTGSPLVSVVNQPITSSYAQRLEPPSKFIVAASPSRIPALCKLESIHLVKAKDDAPPAVLKLLLPTNFLLHSDEEAFSFTARLAAMYREIHVLATIPPHPNIINHPVALVTISHVQDQLVCGFLSSFHPGGTIAFALEPPIPIDTPLLERRIRWAVQMASAIHHLHRVAHTYHGDIKLDNIVLSANNIRTGKGETMKVSGIYMFLVSSSLRRRVKEKVASHLGLKRAHQRA